MAFTNEHLADHRQRLADADKPLPSIDDIRRAVSAYQFAKSVADRHGTSIETYGAATGLFNEAIRVIMQWLRAAWPSDGSVHSRFENFVAAVRNGDETAATQLVDQLSKKKPYNVYLSAPAMGGPMHLPHLPNAISGEFEHGAVELQLAYDAALQRTPEEVGICREVYAAVQQMLHAHVLVYNAIHSKSDEEFCPEELDSSYYRLCLARTQYEALSDVDRARLTTGTHVSYFGSKWANIGGAVRDAALEHEIALRSCSLQPTFSGGSQQLREQHPEPWFNNTGYRSVQLLIGSARQGWDGNQRVLNACSTPQLIDSLLQFVDELKGKILADGDRQLYWLQELDAAIALRLQELPDVALEGRCKWFGFCRIPYYAFQEGSQFSTEGDGCDTDNQWRQMMRIMRARCDEPLSPTQEPVGESAKPSTTKPKSRKGTQSKKIVDYLALHHEYANGSLGNRLPAESADITKVTGVKGNTLSDFFKKEFPYPNGAPRDGYINDCKDEGRLLLWFLRKFDESPPIQTRGSLDDFDPGSIREKF